uniref:Uncharacterized protein n=1 Tax=Oryza rufipogon TaxID=4529 RepID=A0A0E0R5T0_ORYRU
MERCFLLLLLLATGIATGEQPPRRTAVADHPAIVGTTTAAPCDPLCISGAAAGGATPEAMAAASAAVAMAGNESESALLPTPRQLDRPDSSGLPTTHQSWIYYGPLPTTPYPYSKAPPASELVRATTAAAAVVFSTVLLVAAAAR